MADENPGRLYPVKIEAYNSKWPLLFEKEKAYLLNLFDKELRCEHIGSTAVKGLSAKPTIDILLEYPAGNDKSDIIRIMEHNSYIFMKEQTRHLMFVKGYTPAGLAEESYHIHIGPLSQSWLWDRIFFRDYLIENPQEANNYEILKRELASKYKYDRELYTDGKEKYVKMITEKAKFEMNKNTALNPD
jgi:GrpB-like predicted nucleotidyltransferase (UPF0157 family)